MAVWKVLLICASACVCLALATATFVVPLGQQGGQRWAWMGGLLVATLVSVGLFSIFLRYAGKSLDVKPGALRR